MKQIKFLVFVGIQKAYSSNLKIEDFCWNLQQFQIVLKKMAYYIFISSKNNSYTPLSQLQSYYSSISSLFQTTEDFINPSLIPLSWAQTDSFKQNQNALTQSTIIIAQNTQISTTNNPFSQEKSKTRAQKTLEKQIQSAKKNSESNIINQFYSFFSIRQKSQKIVQTCCTLMKKNPEDLQRILSMFYMVIRLINAKRGRKYVNLAMLFKFFNPDQLTKYLPEIVQRLEGSGVLTIDEFCQIFRRCSKHFFSNISPSAILTSKRLSILSKKQHLRKCRKFLFSIMQL